MRFADCANISFTTSLQVENFMIYYIGDTHFGDDRIRRLAGRPYASVEEMDCDLVRKWNKRVGIEDTVCILGDFALDDSSAQVIDKLQGKKVLLLGNHDNVLSLATLRRFDFVQTIYTIDDRGRSVCLCHYPLLSYDRSVYDGYHVFGHIHNNPNDRAFHLQALLAHSLNCSADVVDFTPRTLDELIAFKTEGKI